MTNTAATKSVPKPTASFPKSVTSQTLIELGELIDAFGWKVLRPNVVTHDQIELIHKSLHVAQSSKPLYDAVWDAIEIPTSVCKLDSFSTTTDAKALARVLCSSRANLHSWLDLSNDGASNELITDLLSELGMVQTTPSGSVYCETTEETRIVSIWFGRKAGKACPDLLGADAINAVRLLFNINVVKESIGLEPAKSPIHEEPASSTTLRRDESHATPAPKAARRLTKQPKQTPAAGEPASSGATELRHVALDDIQPAAHNHRKTFDEKLLQELAQSIKANGVLQPLLLRVYSTAPNGNRLYEIVAGERRYRAAKLAGLDVVPAQIQAGRVNDLQAAVAMFEENYRRVDLNPIEKAQAIQTLMSDHGLNQQQVAKRVDVSQGQISNELRLLNLPPVWQQRLIDGSVKPTLIRPLLPFCDVPEVLESIDLAETAENPIDEHGVKELLREAIIKHSRPMKCASWQSFQKPSRKERHFQKCSDEDLKALNPKTIELLHTWQGQDRTFNVELFDSLNAEPLAERMKKHKALKAQRKTASDDHQSSKTRQMFREYKEYEFARCIRDDLTAALIAALTESKDTVAVTRVVWILALAGNLDNLYGNKHHEQGKYFAKLVNATADAKVIVKDVISKLRALRDQYFDKECCFELAELLGVNLTETWKPTKKELELLTDNGLKVCCDASELSSVAPKEMVKTLLSSWPPGLVPEFMRPFFGLPKANAKKKKGKAA